jgi:hypothetical protein
MRSCLTFRVLKVYDIVGGEGGNLLFMHNTYTHSHMHCSLIIIIIIIIH